MSQPQVEMQQDDEDIASLEELLQQGVTGNETLTVVRESDADQEAALTSDYSELMSSLSPQDIFLLLLAKILYTLGFEELGDEIFPLQGDEEQKEKPKRKNTQEHPYIEEYGIDTVLSIEQFREVCNQTDPELLVKILNNGGMSLSDVIKGGIPVFIRIEPEGNSLKLNYSKDIEEWVTVIRDRHAIQCILLESQGRDTFYHIYSVDNCIRVGLTNSKDSPRKQGIGMQLDIEEIQQHLTAVLFGGENDLRIINWTDGSLRFSAEPEENYFGSIEIKDSNEGKTLAFDLRPDLRNKVSESYIVYRAKDGSLIFKPKSNDPRLELTPFRAYLGLKGNREYWGAIPEDESYAIYFETVNAWPFSQPDETAEYIIPPKPHTLHLEA